MRQPIGATIAVTAFLLLLVPLPGVQEALLIGAGLGNIAGDPLVFIVLLATVFCAVKSLHVMAGATVAGLIVAAEPRSSLLPMTLEWKITSALGAILMLALLAGLGAQLITMLKAKPSADEDIATDEP